jgi:hypothetical protein
MLDDDGNLKVFSRMDGDAPLEEMLYAETSLLVKFAT